ncbi:hypothetical protein EN829_040845 [Mesorhizobium sp. M00.F.Ca.ET.186.01.1.1]|nr:hypothetical protein EN829_040845 [Mesorhizobium sp. M00.F.Ca.ET.186.01.1.1]
MFIRVNENKEVTFIHYMPEQLTDEQKADGYVVDAAELPKADMKPGKGGKLLFDSATGVFSYQYYDVPLSPEERIAQLEQQLKITQDALDALLLA